MLQSYCAVGGLSERFGKYHVLGRIAQGGMAEIYKVKTVGFAGFEKVQALKRIRPRFAREARFIRSFIDEARIAVELNHRNIVQVFEFGKADGELFLAMELIEGVDLRTVMGDALRRHLPPPVPTACYVLGEVAAGLDYAHRKTDYHGRSLGIVHCDVSPQNVMLSHEGYVKILDFGVARARFAAQPTTRRLRGKPRYMAPEQTVGRRPTPATDVFSLGVVAWEMLTGLPLFEGNTLADVLAAVRRADAPPVDHINPDVPAPVARAIARALAPDPGDRGTAAELGQVLARTALLVDDESGARALTRWLHAVYAPARAGVARATPAPAPGTASTVDMMPAPDPAPHAVPHAVPPAPVRPLEERPTQRMARAPSHTADTMDLEPDLGPHGHPGAPAVTQIVESIDDDAPMPPLLEKRRVVAVAVLVDGGHAASRHELTEVLGHLAYKHGAVVHARGDADLLAVFGLEVAGEDDVANAMGYALHAIDTARAAASPAADGPRVRIAARAGVVATRDRGGYRLVGDAAEEARALARSAEPGQPLLGGSGGRLTSAYYAFRERPTLRRSSRRLRVVELIGPRTFDERRRALHDRTGRFVGRQQALDLLSRTLDAAVRDRRLAIAAITGASGVGKSRLVTELVGLANGRCDPPPVVIAVAATPLGRMAPFSLVIELVQSGLNLPPGRGEAARSRLAQRLRHTLAKTAREPQDVDGVTGALELAMELRDSAALLPEDSRVDLRERVSAALGSYRRSVAPARQPLIVVIEDLHFADRTSLDVLRSTLAGPGRGAELVVLTTRPAGAGVLPAAGAGEAPAAPAALEVRIDLEELAGAELEALARDRLGSAASAATVAAVVQRAGGNPLFVEQVAEVVREAGWTEIPSSVRALIQAQVDRLPVRTKAVLQHAAVAGLQFRARILEELVGAEVHEELDRLCDKGLLRRAAGGPDQGEGELGFARGLVREVVYDSLSASARRDAHARLGRLLASRYRAGREELPAVIAEHLELGGDLAAAAAFWLRAGRVALAAFDATAAVERFSRTLAIDDRLAAAATVAPAAPAAARSPAALARRRKALAGREQAYRLLGDHEAQGRDLAELMHLARDEPALRADVSCRIAARLLRLGDLQGALAAAERARASAHQHHDEHGVALALCISGEVYERLGQLDRSIEQSRAARDLFRRLEAQADEIRALIGMGRALVACALYEEARAVYDDLVERVQDSRDPWLERLVCQHVAGIHLVLGHFEKAMASARRALDICRRLGDRAREGDGLAVCGTILLALGLFEEAREHFVQALGIHDRTGSLWSRADCLVHAGLAEAHLGAHERGMAHLSEALSIARAIGARAIEASALVAVATSLLRRDGPGDAERARQSAAMAVAVARAATLLGPEILALSRQAEATWRTGALDQALALSRQAVALLDRQSYLEGSEEEVLSAHARLLEAAGHADADAVRARARAGVQRKLALLETPRWREAFLALSAPLSE